MSRFMEAAKRVSKKSKGKKSGKGFSAAAKKAKGKC